MELEYKITSIPCSIDVQWTDVDPELDGAFDCEYHVLNTKGHRSKWLENKITPDIDDEIRAVIFDTIKGGVIK